MSTHKPDDDREFDAFLKGDHAVSREYHRDTDDAVPDSLDAMILRQAAEQAARQQRLQAPQQKPWYRQSWFAPASGLAIAAMVTVVMFYPAQVPLQQSESARMQEVALEEAPARKLMRAPAAPEAVEADSAAASFAMHDAAENTAGASRSDAAEVGMLEEVQVSPRLESRVAEMKAVQSAPAPAALSIERQLAKREKPAMNPEWDLLKALEARDWAAVIDYLDGLPVPAEEITTHIQHIRIAAEQQQLPEQDDLQALYDWLQHNHPQEIAHDRQTTGD